MTSSTEPSPRRRHVRVALVLGAAASLSVVLLYLYLLVLIPKLGRTVIPLWALIPIQAVQGGVQLFALAWIGLRVGESLCLDAPSCARSSRRPSDRRRIGSRWRRSSGSPSVRFWRRPIVCSSCLRSPRRSVR
jgi:hypothetical protein